MIDIGGCGCGFGMNDLIGVAPGIKVWSEEWRVVWRGEMRK